MNTVILFVPQQEAWIVERFGKYQRVLQPVCIIVLDKFSIQILNSQIVKNVSEQIVTFFK
jgi:regulator of protease activity HflC (stomatin/prohibitin superfamily)